MAQSTRKPTILLIENDPVMLPLLRDHFAEHDYRLLVCTDGLAALEILKQRQDQIDLIVVDQFARSMEEVILISRGMLEQPQISSHTPIVVIADQYECQLEGKNVRIGEHQYVSYIKEIHQLDLLIAKLLPA
jgi:CheY-like chemotaxis protein